jgi:type IV secretory pathway VirD2 relaxase
MARARIGVRPPGADARRVVIKAHVARLTATGAKAASLHLRYIQRDGVEKDGTKGLLYGADGPLRVESFDGPRPGENHQFRLIVSPEDAGELGLTDYVKRLMARVERDLRVKLEWAAVNHHDTEHPHAHVIVRGVDKDGREVRLDRAYISNGLRWRAQELATEELGPRPEHDIRRAHVKEITQERFTSLDRELERRMAGGLVEVRSGPHRARIDESTLLARLQHLERLHLAERTTLTQWTLADGWQKRLRELGERGDILKQIHRAIAGNPARYHVVRPGEALPTEPAIAKAVLTGRVASKGLSDELKGVFYAVIETPTGSAYHIPLDARGAESLKPGDIVSLATKPQAPIRPIDRHITEVAGRSAGAYALDQSPAPEANRAARRMRDLERIGLASPVSHGRWAVAPNLLEELSRRQENAAARHRLLMHTQPMPLQEQVRHPGPVWLDRVDAASLALHGFGADVHLALERRKAALRHIGIDPGDPERFAKLRELERKAAGKELAASSRQVFVSAGEGFRGRVLDPYLSPAGASYTAVSDGERFVLLKTNASLATLRGRTVALVRDQRGRLVAREIAERDIGR